MEIYFDTCVYCRPFDDQTQNRIKNETAAFVNVLKLGEMGIVTIVSSDVLIDEIEEIVDPRKRSEVREFITICGVHVALSEEIIKLARDMEDECTITGADALHIASSAGTKYFITCDDYILLKGECIIAILGGEGDSVRDIRERRMKSDIDEIAERIKRRKSGKEMKEESKGDYYRDV
jgi:hypothetical protein